MILKNSGPRDPATPPLLKICRDNVWNVSRNMRSFNRFGPRQSYKILFVFILLTLISWQKQNNQKTKTKTWKNESRDQDSSLESHNTGRFYPRDAMLERVIAIATCLSVCPSVRLSVTRRYCVKTKKASVMISSPSGSPKTLVFWRQISSPNSKGFPRTGASKKGRSEKFSDFFSFKRQYLENGSRYGQSYY